MGPFLSPKADAPAVSSWGLTSAAEALAEVLLFPGTGRRGEFGQPSPAWGEQGIRT